MAATIVSICTWYGVFGLVTAAVFLTIGIGLLDENAQEAWIFRPLLIPGMVLIWPLVLWRAWILVKGEDKLARHRMPRKGQSKIALIMVALIPVILLTALAVRQNSAELPAPLQLEEPQ